MFKTIQQTWPKDQDLPDRAYRLSLLSRVLDGTIYDRLMHAFHEEKAPNEEYIPIRERRPSVRYRLCRLVVDDSASLLFSEGHFPSIQCDDKTAKESIEALAKELKLNEVFVDAVTRGSVGSVAILLRVLQNRPFVSVLSTAYLTPTWNPLAPDTLLSVTERYKVKGKVLKAAGFAADKDAADYWVQRDWTQDEDICYIPLEVTNDPKKQTPSRDEARSTKHGLGFVPMVWILNLPGGDDVDGACTFPNEAIDTNIEMDYQLSQAGRGLKYSSDPTLLIKEPAIGENGTLIRGAGNAIVVGPDGDAKMLEINGTAVEAVINYVRLLRELTIESMHGNRANSEKGMAAPSGKALEMMNQQLIWLADKLRVSYGEGGLLDLLRMLVKAHAKFPLVLKDGTKIPEIDKSAALSLRWPAWYAPTLIDMETRADTLTKLCDGGLMSIETAIKILCDEYDIEDPAAEKALADADMAARNAEAQKQVKISE
jgi:hypothetical protein